MDHNKIKLMLFLVDSFFKAIFNKCIYEYIKKQRVSEREKEIVLHKKQKKKLINLFTPNGKQNLYYPLDRIIYMKHPQF